MNEPRVLTHEQVVAEAAEWYDEHYPDWYRRVDLGLLDMGCGESCIAGQVIPGRWSWETGFGRLVSADSDLDAPGAVHAACFDLSGGLRRGVVVALTKNFTPVVDDLHDAWRDEVKRRFDAGAVA